MHKGVDLICLIINNCIFSIFLQLGEQNEALAHQRLAAKMLATRTKELETRLSLHGDELSDSVTTSLDAT